MPICRIDEKCRNQANIVMVALLVLSMLIAYSPLKAVAEPKAHVEDVPIEVAHPDSDTVQTVKSGDKVELKGAVQQNQSLSALNLKLGFTTKTEKKEELPARITKVFPGSAVAKRGVVAGDELVAEITNTDGSITLTVEHGDQDMRFTLKADELAVLAKAVPLEAAISKDKPAVLESAIDKNKLIATIGNTKKRQMKSIVDVMENHDLGLIVDRSGSMRTFDCPGGLSRWDWCGQQATQLAQAAAEAASTIDASIFNSTYVTYRHISPSQIPEIFQSNGPGGGTEPAYALQEQLENYFNSARSKPLTIVIVTDGLPNHPENIAQVLQDESKKIRYQGEVTITFLLISNQVDEGRLRMRIGLAPGSSVRNGGFVDIVPFTDLEYKGIKQALFEDLREERLCTDPTKPSKASQSALGPQFATSRYGYTQGSKVDNYPGKGVTNYGNNGITNYPTNGVSNYTGARAN